MGTACTGYIVASCMMDHLAKPFAKISLARLILADNFLLPLED